ncbi:acetyltransferase [Corallincola holothuriorum]|uniref:Acetyltransferase n=1 Tax=Corallincola holothuriorum TaxID=2282215 RepID=A0A368N155_9GAMM|nr:acetyltransferase [Corallincola holothuriorum]RCU43285.1 acetyltransferase [Corallincola holothuriorum]
MKNKLIGIYGASGFGREVLPLVREKSNEKIEIKFIDDGCLDKELNEVEVVSYEKFLANPIADKSAVVAIADSNIRKKLLERLERDGISIPSITAANNVVLDFNELGEGSILCPFTTITSNAVIGKGFQANIYSYVAHDCVLGDYVTFAPGVKCNGNVHIDDHAYIGTGAIIKQGTPDKPLVIGEGAVVGMGAVVTKSVKPGDVVFGVPAKSIKRASK